MIPDWVLVVTGLNLGGLLGWAMIHLDRGAWKARALRAEAHIESLSTVENLLVEKTESNEESHPYRTSDKPAESQVEFNSGLTLEWCAYQSKNPAGTAFACPRCDRKWWLREPFCQCDRCATGHFHLTCGGELHKDQITTNYKDGCSAQWIMRSKPLKQPD